MLRRSPSLDARMADVVTPTMSSPTTGAPLQPGYFQSGGGTFFAVLAAVLVVTLLSCIFGRVCAAQAEGPDEWYDYGRLAHRWAAPCRVAVRRDAKPATPAIEVEEAPSTLPLP